MTTKTISSETKRRLMIAYSERHIFSRDEFLQDVNRIVTATKLLDRYYNKGECDLQLLMNQITIIENVFGDVGYFAFFEYLEEHIHLIPSTYTLLYFMGKIKEVPTQNEKLLADLIALKQDS